MVLRLLVLLNFVAIISLAQNSKLDDSQQSLLKVKLVGVDPYMTTETVFGTKIDLKTAEEVELLDKDDRKIKIRYKNQIGYIWPDLISAIDLTIFEKKLFERDGFRRVDKDELELLSSKRYDSIARSYGDSNIYIVRLEKGAQSEVFKHNEILKVEEVLDYYLVKVKSLESKTTGNINPYLFEENATLLAEIRRVIDDRKRKDAESYMAAKRKAAEKVEKQRHVNAEKRERILAEKYGSEVARKIINKEYWIGMTKVQALESLGRPTSINESVTLLVKQEQWVYSRLYLYFENGILTSYQRER